MSSGVKKTNAMRMLDSAKIPYEVRTYEFEETDLAGVHAADAVGMPYETVFKTLVARGETTGFVVCCIPVEFPTYIDETAMLFDAIAVSGGMRGVQLIVNPDQLLGFVKGEYVDLTA